MRHNRTTRGFLLVIGTIVGTTVLFCGMFWIGRPRLIQKPIKLEPTQNRTLFVQKPIFNLTPISQSKPRSIEAETAQKIQILSEIFQSKNDNDPRLDSEFKNLSPHTKLALQKEYKETPVELRNERGTIVFILGRNLNSQEDFQFFKQVISEPPCLSLSDCTKAPDEDHSETSTQVGITLEYPQIVVLKSLQNFLSQRTVSHPGSPENRLALQVLQDAKKSQSLVVSQMASTLIRSLPARE